MRSAACNGTTPKDNTRWTVQLDIARAWKISCAQTVTLTVSMTQDQNESPVKTKFTPHSAVATFLPLLMPPFLMLLNGDLRLIIG